MKMVEVEAIWKKRVDKYLSEGYMPCKNTLSYEEYTILQIDLYNPMMRNGVRVSLENNKKKSNVLLIVRRAYIPFDKCNAITNEEFDEVVSRRYYLNVELNSV